MLNRLSITNLAIIENIDVTFKDGFTVLTGETGAGKSLVIDSLSLLLGARASAELIRQGEEKAVIKGYFSLNKPQLNALLSKLNIPNQGEIIIERTIGRSKNSIKVNNVSISLAELTKISSYIADIHSQFDYEQILNPENYLGIIDGFSFELISSYKNEYTSLLNQYKQKKEEYFSLLERQKKINESRDFYLYQYNELKNMNLRDDEEEEIESELSLLKNYDKVYSLQQEARELINGDFLDKFYELNKTLEKLATYQSQISEKQKTLDDRYYEINDMLSDVKKEFQDIDYDPSRLDELEQRDSDLSELKRKYKKNYKELIEYRDELSLSLGENSTLEEELNSKKKEKDELFKATLEKGKELSLIRQKISKTIEKELENSLSNLLLKAKFQIIFAPIKENDDTCLLESGIDNVDFYIETNVGEGLKSLSKVISGGEASRIMLAFKALFVKANKIPTIIFDEIDTGISGETAQAIAKKIHEISLSSQVIAITHMPQVASLSDHHILIEKSIKGNRTFVKIKELSLDEKIRQVAYLISGGKITEKQLEYAKEMVLSKRD